MVQTIKRKLRSRYGRIAMAAGLTIVLCGVLAWSLSPMERAKAGPDIAANKLTVSVETEFLAGSLWRIAGTQVTSTGAELNYVDVTPGTATASKAVVLDGSKGITTITSASITTLTTAAIAGSDTSLGITGKAGAASDAGGAVLITAGSDPDTQDGGAASLIGGATTAGATGTGGAAVVEGGANGNTTDGAGGAASITGGAGKGTGVGGTVTVAGGAAAGSVTGGNVVVTSGTSGSGIAGNVYLRPATGKPLMTFMPAPTADSGATTSMTEAILLSSVHAKDPAGAISYQVPTGTEISVAVGDTAGGLTVGDSFLFTLINTGNAGGEDITLTVDTGVTFVGSVILAPAADDPTESSSATWRVRNTGANTWIMYRL